MTERTSVARQVPARAPSPSTTTPRRLGEDRAASRAARSGPSTRASVPPRASEVSSTTPSPRPAGRAQPRGWRRSSTTSTHPSLPARAAASPTPEPSATVGSSCSGMLARSKPSARYPRSRPRKSATKPLAGWASSSCGRASWAIRPPTRSTATWLPSLIASSMSWVTMTIVLPSSPCSRRNSSCSCSRTTGSTALQGSSMSMTGGSAASARATPTRCCWPPDNWLG